MPLNAVVTGGSKGIGFGIAACLLGRGYAVTIAGRSQVDLTAAVSKLKSLGPIEAVAADVTNEDDVERLMSRFDDPARPLSLLVNNAGVSDYKTLLKMDLARWRSVLDINLTGVFLSLQRGARRMRASGGGAIVNVASIDAAGTDGRQSAYGAAKAGVVNLTKSAAVELAPYGIRVNSVSPGWTLTAMIDDHVSEAARRHMTESFSRVPLGRLVEVDEIARTVAFLGSNEASGITGIDVPVDCGTLANLYIAETLPKE
ncbi:MULTISPECIES: SDR family NAD(P)-dependent oxidoreductase [unclassified Mesorhizobium]|uniref:SDR family NAD(P)-dependent oxidoreductase n=1 Tax=unclassified Mesorhizobium TaxID=325217 RepID=UPI000464D1B1|nr:MULTISPECIES: SDR family oxidoreductase [unclassified Mesorhizobium]